MITADLTQLQCGNCGVIHAIPTAMYASCRDEGGFWHCPNGHQRGWRDGANKTEMANLRRERDRLLQRVAQKDDEVKDREREVAAQKGLVTKLKKRAAAGSCPCCQRSFSNMATHIRKQHPEYVADNVVRLTATK
jgi:hypothetical protein